MKLLRQSTRESDTLTHENTFQSIQEVFKCKHTSFEIPFFRGKCLNDIPISIEAIKRSESNECFNTPELFSMATFSGKQNGFNLETWI